MTTGAPEVSASMSSRSTGRYLHAEVGFIAGYAAQVHSLSRTPIVSGRRRVACRRRARPGAPRVSPATRCAAPQRRDGAARERHRVGGQDLRDSGGSGGDGNAGPSSGTMRPAAVCAARQEPRRRHGPAYPRKYGGWAVRARPADRRAVTSYERRRCRRRAGCSERTQRDGAVTRVSSEFSRRFVTCLVPSDACRPCNRRRAQLDVGDGRCSSPLPHHPCMVDGISSSCRRARLHESVHGPVAAALVRSRVCRPKKRVSWRAAAARAGAMVEGSVGSDASRLRDRTKARMGFRSFETVPCRSCREPLDNR